jgi:hypothetical protein
MKKNIYIIYPAGYAGSYIHWMFTKSDPVLGQTTVSNPINVAGSPKFGGPGTSHLHYKIPTHIGIRYLMHWMITHRPTEKQCYSLNASTSNDVNMMVDNILCFDPDPVIIHIISSTPDTRAFGGLLGLTKWPLYWEFVFPESDGIDVFKIKDNLNLRNKIIANYDAVIPWSNPLSYIENKIPWTINSNRHTFDDYRKFYKHWFETRNKANPHEVNADQFLPPVMRPSHYYTIELTDIFKPEFPSQLATINEQCGAIPSGIVQMNDIHDEYIRIQPYKNWFTSIEQFRKDWILTEDLLENSVTEALAIREVMHVIPSDMITEPMTTEAIVNGVKKFMC